MNDIQRNVFFRFMVICGWISMLSSRRNVVIWENANRNFLKHMDLLLHRTKKRIKYFLSSSILILEFLLFQIVSEINYSICC